MIADIYKCPKCGTNVYLGQNEPCCTICATSRDEMELIETGVDLKIDSEMNEPTYANFAHIMEILRVPLKDEAGLYVMDCWKYAWDATKIDSLNIDSIEAFINNPNEYVKPSRKTPMTEKELAAEISRLLTLAASKAKIARDGEEMVEFLLYQKETTGCPDVKIFVSKDLTTVTAAAHYPSGNYRVENYVPVEKNNLPPTTNKGFSVYNCLPFGLNHDVTYIPVWAKRTSRYIALDCTRDKTFFDKIRFLFYKIDKFFYCWCVKL